MMAYMKLMGSVIVIFTAACFILLIILLGHFELRQTESFRQIGAKLDALAKTVEALP